MRFLQLLPLVALLSVVQDPSPKKPMMPRTDVAAPTLRLNDQAGRIVELGGKRENWTVLAFFPKAATPG